MRSTANGALYFDVSQHISQTGHLAALATTIYTVSFLIPVSYNLLSHA
jgi:hypothetical protein